MITDFIIAVIYNVLSGIVFVFELLPSVSLPSDIQTNIAAVSPYYAGIETVFPVGTLIDILAVELVFIGGYFFYKLVRWAYRKIPGID